VAAAAATAPATATAAARFDLHHKCQSTYEMYTENNDTSPAAAIVRHRPPFASSS